MKILWVEDDIDRLRGLLMPIQKLGFEIIEAETYEHAIDIINSGTTFSLAIIDLIIPQERYEINEKLSNLEVPGINVCRQLRQKYPDIPIVIISVVIDSAIDKELLDIGVTKIFRKGALFPSDLKDELLNIMNKNVNTESEGL